MVFVVAAVIALTVFSVNCTESVKIRAVKAYVIQRDQAYIDFVADCSAAQNPRECLAACQKLEKKLEAVIAHAKDLLRNDPEIFMNPKLPAALHEFAEKNIAQVKKADELLKETKGHFSDPEVQKEQSRLRALDEKMNDIALKGVNGFYKNNPGALDTD